MATLPTVIASIRAAVDHDTDNQGGTDAQLTAWINEEYQTLRRQINDLIPDLYTALSGEFTLAAGVTTFAPGGPPLNLGPTLEKIRAVEYKEGGTDFRPLPLAPFFTSGFVSYRSWRLLFGPTIEFLPPRDTAGTYRIRYTLKAAVLSGSADVLLPDGAEKVLAERVAARVRVRLEESPVSHLAAADAAWAELQDSLFRTYLSAPIPVEDVTGVY